MNSDGCFGVATGDVCEGVGGFGFGVVGVGFGGGCWFW